MRVVLVLLALDFAVTSGSTHLLAQVKLRNNQLKTMNGRIVNGYTAKEGIIPYIVGLEMENEKDYWPCGGSIIGNRWILTAAHCTWEADDGTIYYGSSKLKKGVITHKVGKENIIQHDDYDSITDANDIALIRTPHVKFSNTVKKIELTHDRQSYAGKASLTCGWGLLLMRGSTPEDLQCAKLTVIGNQRCKQWDDKTYKQLCVRADKADICDGDSGGPLVVERKLIGITSYETVKCRSGVPSVFTRVSAYLNWIHDITGF